MDNFENLLQYNFILLAQAMKNRSLIKSDNKRKRQMNFVLQQVYIEKSSPHLMFSPGIVTSAIVFVV